MADQSQEDHSITVLREDNCNNDELCDGNSQADVRQSTELTRLHQNYSRVSSRRDKRAIPKPSTLPQHIGYAVRRFWRHQVSVVVAHEHCRDHLALERTFLGYLRTSLVLSMMGAIVAQLFRLQRAPSPDPRFGFFVIGKPLACICHGAAIAITAIGAYKSWRMQNAMVRGKAISGGFEIILIGVGVFLILVTFFVLLIAVDIKKTHF